MERFRGNLVLDGGEAYEEDNWDTLTINGTTLQVRQLGVIVCISGNCVLGKG